MRDISLGQVLELHRRIMETSGGVPIILNLGALESAVQRHRMAFGGKDLYITLAISIIRNHPFLDGNKGTGYAAMEVFLVLNGTN